MKVRSRELRLHKNISLILSRRKMTRRSKPQKKLDKPRPNKLLLSKSVNKRKLLQRPRLRQTKTTICQRMLMRILRISIAILQPGPRRAHQELRLMRRPLKTVVNSRPQNQNRRRSRPQLLLQLLQLLLPLLLQLKPQQLLLLLKLKKLMRNLRNWMQSNKKPQRLLLLNHKLTTLLTQ
jgi:hypothetical protein